MVGAAGGDPHWDVATAASPTIETTIVTVAGRRAYRWNTVGAAANVRLHRTMASNSATCRFAFRFETLPDVDITFGGWSVVTGSPPMLRYRTATQDVVCSIGATVGGSPFAISAGVWYVAELRGEVNTNPRTLDAQIRVGAGTPTALGQASSGVAGTTINTFRVGLGTGAEASPAQADLLVDDIAHSSIVGDYPLGHGYVAGLRPAADGTHNASANTDFQVNDTTNIATNATDTWQQIDDLLDNITDFLAVNGGAIGEYLEWTCSAMPPAVSVNGAEVVSAHHSAGSAANKQTLRLVDGGSTNDVFVDADFSQTSLCLNTKQYTTAPSGGAWTQAKLNAIKFRWGAGFSPSTADISPVPYIDALCVEVDYTPAPEPSVGTVVADGLVPTATVTNNILVTAALGAVTAAGLAPTVLLPSLVTPALGAVTAAGLAPTAAVSNNQTVTPALGEVTAAGLAPTATVTANTLVTPALGAVTAAGLEPTVTVTANTLVTPALGDVTAAGLAPTASVTNHVSVTTDLGTVVAAGLAPTVTATTNTLVRTDVGAVTADGLAPTVTASAGTTVTPALGELTAAGLAPTATVTANALVRPDVGAVTAAGLAPTAAVSDNQTVTPALGTAVIAGLAPTASVTDFVVVLPQLGTATIAGLAPTVSVTNHLTVTPATGTATLAGLAPTVVTPVLVTAGLGAVTAVGLAPTITIAVTVTPATGDATLAGLAPTVLTPVVVTPACGAVVAAGLEPLVLTPVTVVVAPGELAATGYEPSVTATANVLVRPGVGELEAVGWAPDIDTGATEVEPGTGVLTIRGLRPAATVTVTPSSGSVVNVRTLADWADLILRDGRRRRRRD